MSAGKERVRRARRSVGERNYVCGCNKAYMSYPALYTHVRAKHDGAFPHGSAVLQTAAAKPESARLFSASLKLVEEELNAFLKYNSVAKPLGARLDFEEELKAASDDAFTQTFTATRLQKHIIHITREYLRWLHSRVSADFFAESALLFSMFIDMFRENAALANAIEAKAKTGADEDKRLCEAVCKSLNLFFLEYYPLSLAARRDAEPLFLSRTERGARFALTMAKLFGVWLFATKRISFRFEPNVSNS